MTMPASLRAILDDTFAALKRLSELLTDEAGRAIEILDQPRAAGVEALQNANGSQS